MYLIISLFCSKLCVMFNFMCRLDWAKGYSDRQLNTISGCQWGSFQKKLAFEAVDLLMKICPYLCGWTSSSPPRAQVEQACGEWGHPSFSALRHWWSLFSGCWAWLGTYIIVVPPPLRFLDLWTMIKHH